MHRTTPQLWERFEKLPESVQSLARKSFELLERDSSYPSLRFKKTGRFWSARVGLNYRALAVEDGPDFIWVWIGDHDEYERLIG
jgi:hypothetical protein